MKCSLARYDVNSQDAADLRRLLADPAIWELMRQDGRKQQDVIDRDWTGSILSIIRNGTGQERGFIIFMERFFGIYEMHVGFLEDYRGSPAVSAVKEIGRRMFIETNATEFIMQCPEWHVPCQIFASALGAEMRFKVANFAVRDGNKYGSTLCHRLFSDYVFENLHTFNVAECTGNRDVTTARMMSAAVEIAKFQPVKAQSIYNLYAGLAGMAGMKATEFIGGCVLNFEDLRIFVSGGKIALSESLPCHSQPSDP